MKFTENDYLFLEGKKFGEGFVLQLSNNECIRRSDFILDLVKDKTVLHIGCCDHIPLIEQKIKKNSWLHGEMRKQCKEVVGIDINEEAIDWLKKSGLGDDIHLSNVLTDEAIKPKSGCYDFIILGEIVEHLDNPVSFLSELQRKYNGLAKKILVTVPNAYGRNKLRQLRKFKESINSDHRFWFTPFTISKVLSQSGIKPIELFFVDNFRAIHRLSYWLTGKRIKWRSIFGETIVAIGDMS